MFATYGWDFWRQSGTSLEDNFDFDGMLPLPPSAQSDGLPPPPMSDAVTSTSPPRLPARPRPRWDTLHPAHRRREATGIPGVRPSLNRREQKYEARCCGLHLGTFPTADAAAASIAAASVGGPADLLEQRRMQLMEATADAFVTAAVDTGVDDPTPPHSTSSTSAPLDAPENTHHLAVQLGVPTHTRAGTAAWLSATSASGYLGVGKKRVDPRNKKPQDQLLKQYWSQNQRDGKAYHDTLDEALEHYAAQRAIALSRSTVPRQLLAPRVQQKNRSASLAVTSALTTGPATGPGKTLPPGWRRDRRVSASGKPYLIYIGPDDAATRSSKTAWAMHATAVAAGAAVPAVIATAVAAGTAVPVVPRIEKRKHIEGIHDMWRTVLQQVIRRQSMPPPAAQPPSLPPSPPSPRLAPPTPAAPVARMVDAMRLRALVLMSLLQFSDATPSAPPHSEGEIALPLLSALVPPPLLIITTVAVIAAAIIILSLLLLPKPPRTTSSAYLLLISLIFLPQVAAAPVDSNAVCTALQPLVITFGLTAVSAAISSMATHVSNQEGESDQEGVSDGEGERSESDRGSLEEGDPSLPPGLGLTSSSIQHSSTALASPQSNWSSPAMPSLRCSPPQPILQPPQPPVRRSRQSARFAEYLSRRRRQSDSLAVAPVRQWISLFIAGAFCRALRMRVAHRRQVLTRCTLLLRPQCRRFVDRLRSGHRLAALKLIAAKPRPVGYYSGTGLYDVGYDQASDRFSFRDIHGAVTYHHPAAAASSRACAYAPDGTAISPVSPPPTSAVVLSPESSGGWCYYDTVLGDASWFPPAGSTPLRHQQLTSVQLPPGPPPALPATIGLNSLRFTGWTPFFRDATNEVFLMNLSTGAVREGPWISLRTAGGLIYFANLVSRETRYLPPHRWMSGWISRMSYTAATYAADCHPCASLAEGRTYDPRMPQIGVYGRQCVEGGAPYLCDSGRPQYSPDEFDTPETYPLDGFVRLPETETYSERHGHHVRVGPRWVPAAISPAESAAAPQAAPQPDSRLHDSNGVLRAAALSSPPPPPSSGNHSDTGSDRHSDTSDDILSEVYFGATGGEAVENNVVGTGEDAIESDRLGSPSSDSISGEHSASGSTASGSLRPTPSGSAMPLTTEPDFRSFAQQASLIGAISASDARAISLQLMRGTITALEAVAELVLRISPYERAGGIIARAWRRYAFYSLENAGYTHDDAGRSGLILLDPPFRFLTRHTDGVTHLLTALSVGGL